MRRSAMTRTWPCGRYGAALRFALTEQEFEGQFHVILGQHFFDGACLQCRRQHQARREHTAQRRELLRQALQFLLLDGGGTGTLPPSELLGIPPHIVELGAMRLAHSADRITACWRMVFTHFASRGSRGKPYCHPAKQGVPQPAMQNARRPSSHMPEDRETSAQYNDALI